MILDPLKLKDVYKLGFSKSVFLTSGHLRRRHSLTEGQLGRRVIQKEGHPRVRLPKEDGPLPVRVIEVSRPSRVELDVGLGSP